MKKVIHAKFEKEKAEVSESSINNNLLKQKDTIQKCYSCPRKFRSTAKFAYHEIFHNEEVQKTRIKNLQTTSIQKKKKCKQGHDLPTNKDISSNRDLENTSKNKKREERRILYKLKLRKCNQEWTLVTLPCIQSNKTKTK